MWLAVGSGIGCGRQWEMAKDVTGSGEWPRVWSAVGSGWHWGVFGSGGWSAVGSGIGCGRQWGVV